MQTQQIIIAGGCFWCIEAPMQRLKGVSKAISGYMGGDVENPSYRQICSGTTGHAEVVVIDFDPEVISYQQLLIVFFSLHDPTSLNRQGNDCGSQYRSAIFYVNQEQQLQAQHFIDEIAAQNIYPSPIVTTIEPCATFYPAEQHHQDYYDNHREQPYCQIMIKPKLDKLTKVFHSLLKDQ